MSAADLLGVAFNHWTVIGYAARVNNKPYWLCRCTCGIEKAVCGPSLTGGKSRSCGCQRSGKHIRRALSGKRFGEWTVLSFSHRHLHNPYWICQCVCGEKRAVCLTSLTSGTSRSCGCKSTQLRQDTCFANYAVPHAAQSDIVQRRIVQTCLSRFGTERPLQSQSIRDKAGATCMARYGVGNPSQNHSIGLRQARAVNSCAVLRHWYSNEDVVCVGSYERLVVEYLNSNRIDYLWQVQTFALPPDMNGNMVTYRPDLYLPDQNIWVEIKGFFRDDALEKWRWFHATYPNSELWNKQHLQSMGLLK
jgi:hypothetical protein